MIRGTKVVPASTGRYGWATCTRCGIEYTYNARFSQVFCRDCRLVINSLNRLEAQR